MDTEYLNALEEILTVGKLLSDCKRDDILRYYRDYVFNPEEGMNAEYFCYSMLDMLCEECLWLGDDTGGFYSIHFRDSCMTDYFALCKEHARREGIPFREDPYTSAALREVHDWMDSDCPCCDWRMKLFERNNSRPKLIFYYTEDFYWHTALFTRILRVLDFFQTAGEKLRQELYPHIPLERAA